MKKMIACLVLVTVLLAASCALAESSGPKLKITEACAENDFVWSLDFADYIELHNEGEESVELGQITLIVGKKKAALPAMELAPDAYVVLKCDGDEVKVKLPKDGCEVSLVGADGEVIDAVTLPAMKNNQVWLERIGLSSMPSPGYPNTVSGETSYYRRVHGDLIISEALSGNFRSYHCSAERYVDAVELYNAGSMRISLGSYYISDSKKNLQKYRLPDVYLDPGQYYVLICSENNFKNSTGFKLSSTGENLYLSTSNGKISDVLAVPELPLDVSYGRSNGMLMYFETPSLGSENLGGKRRIAPSPTFSVGSGNYAKTFQVEIQGEGPIYYTLDGSVPNRGSKRYSGPITISGTTQLRAVSIPLNAVCSKPATAVYSYEALHYTLPVAYVTTQRDYLNGKGDSLYRNTMDTTLEIPAHVTFIEKNKVKFELDCGLGIHGHTSRNHSKKNYKLRFRSKYGQDSLDYQIFEDYDVTDFDSIVFRVGTHDLMINDAFGAAICAESMPSLLFQHFKPANLFINGEYNGVYYIREHINANFVVNALGGDEDSVDIVYGPKTTEHGDGTDLFNLMQYCRVHNLSDQAKYEYVANRLNLDSLIDYYILRPYTGDTDTPNIRYVRSRNAEDPRWHLVIYDMDWAWSKQTMSLHLYTYHLTQTDKVDNTFIVALMENSTFRQMYLDRLSYHLNNTFAPDHLFDKLDQMNSTLRHDMGANVALWGSSLSNWDRHIREIKAFILSGPNNRRKLLAQETVSALHLTEREARKYFPFLYQ